MNLKSTLLLILLFISGFTSMAQNPCNCPDDGLPVCAEIEEDGETFYLPLPNECFALCLGFTIIADSLCFTAPWSDCDCDIDENEPEICVQFDGYTFKVPNDCIADCKGFTIVGDSLCSSNTFSECNCEYDAEELWICAEDSLGYTCLVPNACYADCWGLTVVSDELCDDSDIIDFGTFECFDDLEIGGDMLFQEILIAIDESCDNDLPECILDAPLFSSDSLFLEYILNNCNLFGSDNNNTGPTVFGLYNLLRSTTSKTNDSQVVLNTSIQLATNPVTNNLSYFIESKNATDALITLFDMNGRVILSNNLQLSAGTQKYENDISQLKEGLYMLNLRTQEGQQTLKVVIFN